MNCKQIIGLPVETESGQSVGKVSDIVLDIDTNDLLVYRVAVGTFLRGLVGGDDELEVLPAHVRSISVDKMVVADLAAKEKIQDVEGAQEVDTAGVGVVRPVATEVK